MIPDFQKIMLPFLNLLMDGAEHSTIETNEKLANYFGLTEDEVNQYLPSGSQKIFSNRVAWTKSYLKMYGLLEATKRGCFMISNAGKQFMLQNPIEVNVKILKQWASLTPQKRIPDPSELKGIFVFLASDAASYFTGSAIIGDGGYTLP